MKQIAVFQVEKITDLGDNISEEDKSNAESKML